MQWINTQISPPPQGTKVLCFKNGDCWTAYRFSYKDENIWIAAVPSCNLNPKRTYQMGKCDEPDYWASIPFERLPGTYTGRMMVKAEGDEKMYDVDEFQVIYPKEHDIFIKDFIFSLNTKKKSKRGKA